MKVHLTLRNVDGSVQHYPHFLLGFLIPLVKARYELLAQGGVERIYIRSCDVMDNLLRELNFPEVVIVSKAEHEAMRLNPSLTFKIAPGYDFIGVFDANVFRGVKAVLMELLPVQKHRLDILSRFQAGRKIVLIKRSPPDEFYSTAASDYPEHSSGTDRRSIPNIDELNGALQDNFGNVSMEVLKGKSLAYQIALFDVADIVIGQHGGDLVNLVWANSGAGLLEIYPKDMVPREWYTPFFVTLTKTLNQNHVMIDQESLHSEVDVPRVIDAMNSL
jgi:Glycosyltransferase 61